MKYSIDDIAREAGVSRGTVSRVLNDKPDVKESTRKRVLDAMKRRNYTPRTARKDKKKQIGVVVENFWHYSPYATALVGNIVEEANTLDYDVTIVIVKYYENYKENVRQLLIDKGLDGIIVLGNTFTETAIAAIAEAHVPHIVINNSTRGKDLALNTVISDVEPGMLQCISHLHDIGHRDIVFARHDTDSLVGQNLMETFTTIMRHLNLPLRNEQMLHVKRTTPENGELMFYELANSEKNLPTAIIASQLLLGVGIIRGARKLGIDIPRDLSLVVFGDPYASDSSSQDLTYISQNLPYMAEVAMRELDLLIEGEKEDAHELVSTKLVVQRTCAHAPETIVTTDHNKELSSVRGNL